ncbi:MAG TPA: FAD-dependent oxidoreductase [Caldimonas sp.]
MNSSYDVVVLGSGLSGVATALAARKLGLKTLVLEKAALLGGGTCYSSGLVWVGCNHLARNAGLTDRPELVREYMQFMGGGQQTPENMEAFVDEAPRALKFFEDCGIAFSLVRGMADHHFQHAPGALAQGRTVSAELICGRELGVWSDKIVRPRFAPYSVTAEELVAMRSGNWPPGLLDERKEQDLCGLGVGLIVHFLKAALGAGVEVCTDQNVLELAKAGDHVRGVVLADGRHIDASAVVIATGGYESNPEMVRNFESVPGWHSYFPASLQGDGIDLGTRAGAALRVIHNQMQLFLGFPVPIENESSTEFRLAGIVELCSPHTIVVNRQGRRFADESVFQRVAARLRDYDHERREFLNLPCFLIFDHQFTERFSFGGRPVGDIPSWVSRAQTLRDLAVQLELDPASLEQTTRRFNQGAVDGVDLEFGRRGDPRFADRPSLGALVKAPFFGIELKPAGSGSAGLVTDRQARVMGHGASPVRNLYAVGNAAAKTEIGVGYQAGLTLSSSLTFGLLCAEHIALSSEVGSE